MAVAALVVACGGGGGGGEGSVNQPAPPVAEVPVVLPPAPEPVQPAPPEPVATGSLEVIAGRAGGPGYLDGIGADARLNAYAIVVDSAGNAVVTDGRSRIRRITPQGQVSTLVTGLTGATGLAMDRDGNFFVAADYRILKISAAGVVSTYAGSGVSGTVDGAAAAAQFLSPRGLALAADGTLYVSDYRTVRRISPDGIVSTLAGQANAFGSQDGPGAQATFQGTEWLALDAQGRVIVADRLSIRAVDAAGNVSTLVRMVGDAAGALAVRDGVIYVRSAATGGVLRLAGDALVPVTGPGPVGYANGAAADARFDFPSSGMAFDGSGNLYLVDQDTSVLRRLDTQGMVSTVAGTPASRGKADGPAATASFERPDSLAQDGAGNLYVTDSSGHTIRRIAGGIVTTFAGTPGDKGLFPSYTSPTLNAPSGLVSDGADGLYVVEEPSSYLRHVDSNGVLGTRTESGGRSPSGYPIDGASRSSVTLDGSGGVYISDTGLHVIRHIDSQGKASVLAGESDRRVGDTYAPGVRNADGKGVAARFSSPGGIVRDAAGNLYVADSGNNTIRKITPAGDVTTFAGVAGPPGDADGPAATARFNYPIGLAIDGAGKLYVADRDNALIRKITPAGVVGTVAGQRGLKGIATGPLPAALNQPFGVLVGKQGDLYVTDTSERVIFRITLP